MLYSLQEDILKGRYINYVTLHYIIEAYTAYSRSYYSKYVDFQLNILYANRERLEQNPSEVCYSVSISTFN